MPSKASLPSALVDPMENAAPQSIDSGGRHSKQSSSRSKISSAASSTNNDSSSILKKFKLFRQKSTEIKNYEPTKDDPLPQRKPSLVITPDSPDYESGFLKPPAMNLTPPSPVPSTASFLKAPGFLRVTLSTRSLKTSEIPKIISEYFDANAVPETRDKRHR